MTGTLSGTSATMSSVAFVCELLAAWAKLFVGKAQVQPRGPLVLVDIDITHPPPPFEKALSQLIQIYLRVVF